MVEVGLVGRDCGAVESRHVSYCFQLVSTPQRIIRLFQNAAIELAGLEPIPITVRCRSVSAEAPHEAVS
jgi:hypothetical protein